MATRRPIPIRHLMPPVCSPRARVLILGSMPGAASLAAREYYAYPRNTFWEIMDDLAGAGRTLPYAERLERLSAQGIALWDVVAECRRSGSLDTAIDPASVRPNPLHRLVAGCPGLRLIAFNGGAADQLFRRHVLKAHPAAFAAIRLERLPSTSPAHAGVTPAEKRRRWRDVIKPFL